MRIQQVSVVAVLVAVAACSGPDDSASAEPLKDCGSFSYGLSMAEVPASAITCMRDANRSGSPARLTVTRSTDEGDPVPVTWTSEAAGTVLIETDSRQDRFGPQAREYQRCSGTSAAPGRLAFARCWALPDRQQG